MAQLKAHEVENWLRRPNPFPIVMIYGPDRGLVSERARAFAEASKLPLDDPFTVVRMDAGAVEEAGGLLDEAQTISMFSSDRLIWVRNAGAQKKFIDDVKALADDPPAGATILIEAGDLKKGVGLRAIVEASKSAIALPCYADAGRDLDSLIDDELARSQIGIEPEARALLKRLLGGDRLATRSELTKLALFAAGEPKITVQHVSELSGDVAELSLGEVIDAVTTGDLGGFDRQFHRYIGAGGQLFLVHSAMLREFWQMRPMRAEMELKGKSASQLVEQARPPIHFSRKANVQAALSLWPLEALDRALGRLQECVLDSRRRADLADDLTHRLLMALCAEASRRLQRR